MVLLLDDDEDSPEYLRFEAVDGRYSPTWTEIASDLPAVVLFDPSEVEL